MIPHLQIKNQDSEQFRSLPNVTQGLDWNHVSLTTETLLAKAQNLFVKH